MKPQERWLWAVAIFLIDFVTIGLPLTALFAAYVLVARPPWFQEWVVKLYQDKPSN